MEHVRWSSRPRLRTPVVIAAFAGWNDAGEAASNAVTISPTCGRPAIRDYRRGRLLRLRLRRDRRAARRRRRRSVSPWPINELSARRVLARRHGRRAADRHRASAEVAHVLLRGARGRDRAERSHAHHARRAARRGPALTARLGDRHRRRSHADRATRAAALPLRRPDRHRRCAARCVQHRRAAVALAVGRSARVRPGPCPRRRRHSPSSNGLATCSTS